MGTTTTRARHCAAAGCPVEIEPGYLFCRPHWDRLPKSIRLAVWDSCRPGTGRDLRPTMGWLEAAASAIEHLADADGRDRRNRHRDALLRRVAAGQGGAIPASPTRNEKAPPGVTPAGPRRGD